MGTADHDPGDPAYVGHHRFEVGEEAAGERLDSWLHGRFPDLSRSLLKRYVQEQRVTVDGRAPKPSVALRAGAVVEIDVPAPPPPLPVPEDIPLRVLYQDDAILVIDKSPDIVVHPSPGGAHAGGTVVNALLGYTDDLSREGGDYRPGIVHRLDRETSGVLVVARTDAAHRAVAAQFKDREVKKEYLALCHGVPAATTGEIDLPLGRSLQDRKKMAVRPDADGKAAQTRWEVERTLRDAFTWFRLHPVTGRTHQIRVHLKSIGHPILCDALYGREKRITHSELIGRRPRAGEEPVLERHALHASRLRLRHPHSGEWLDFRAALPADLAELWDL